MRTRPHNLVHCQDRRRSMASCKCVLWHTPSIYHSYLVAWPVIMYFLIPLANMNTYVAFAIVCQFLSYIVRQASLNQWYLTRYNDLDACQFANHLFKCLQRITAYLFAQLALIFFLFFFISSFLSRNERRLWHKHAASAANRGTTIINHHHATTTTTTTTNNEQDNSSDWVAGTLREIHINHTPREPH